MKSFDVVINGSGIIGLTLACGLQKIGLRVAVIHRKIPKMILSKNRLESRVSSINDTSRKLLQYLQVWNHISTLRVNPYKGIEVWDKDGFGKTSFDSIQLGYSHLGYIIENIVIYKALWNQINKLTNITIMNCVALKEVLWKKNETLIILNNNQMFTSKLMVAADGTHSWLRNYANITLNFWDYQHHALIGTVRTEKKHGDIARQAFHGDGILAFLPLSDPYLSSIVWSMPPKLADKRLMQPTSTFNSELAINFSLSLGLCELQGSRYIFPLRGSYAKNFISHRLVLIGDSAHTIHPLAGQGMNLGFMDIVDLLDELKILQKNDKDIGHYLYLRRYEQKRKKSAFLMLVGMQIFRETFNGMHPLKVLLRNISLCLADSIPGVKLTLMRQAMGLNDIPDWLSNEYFD